ncbi:MAG: TetR/AcrR family transcriptional regulator [Thermomicrobiales bacterium]
MDHLLCVLQYNYKPWYNDHMETSTPLRRARNKQRTHARILDAAIALFVKQGYDSTTIDQIVVAADVARGTFFNYFPAKSDLLLAWGETHRREIEERLTGLASGAVLGRLQEAFAHAAESYDADAAMNRAMVRSWLGAGGPLLPGAGATLAVLIPIVEAGQRDGEIRADIPPDIAAQCILDCYLGQVYRWAQGDASLGDLLPASLDVVLAGLAADRPGQHAPAHLAGRDGG